jgi:sugar lactone lactonase YvrE
MKSLSILAILLGVLGAMAVVGQNPPPARKTGPGTKASQDAKEPDLLKTCKTPPPAPGARGGGGGRGRGTPPPPAPRTNTATEIPGVIAAGQQWKEIWQVDGNNADGIIGTKDGGLLLAQNDNSAVVKLDKNGKASVAYMGTNTGGSVAMNSKGVLFVANRGLNESIEELAPQRKTLANKINGDDPLDCIGADLNDIAADNKGGVYFTTGKLFYTDPKGKVTQYGENLGTNGIILSADEKHLYVTNGGTLAGFDVQPDGSLTNQHEFAKWDGGGGDGSTFDSAGRIYVTTNPGVRVIGPDGKNLGLIPTPRNVLSVAFSGPDRKMLYAVSREGDKDWIVGIQMIAQGAKGRGK